MKRPWMPVYVGDYLRDTMHLHAAAHGAYLLLLFHCWVNGSVPDDDRQLASIARCDFQQWCDEVGPLVRPFFTSEDGKLRQSRVTKEISHAEGISKTRRDAANRRKNRRGGRPRKEAAETASEPATEQQENSTETAKEQQKHVQPQPQPHTSPNGEESPPSEDSGARSHRREPSPAPTPQEVQQAFDAWNAMARRCNVIQSLVLDDQRRSGIKRMLRKHGMDGWLDTLERIRLSKFCNGGGARGWRADILWLFQKDAWSRLHEGLYDNNEGRNPSNRTAWLQERKAVRREAERAARSDPDQNGPVIEGHANEELELTP